MINEITGTITRADGSTSEFSIDASSGLTWSQWGAGESHLWETAEALEAMTDGLRAAGVEFGDLEEES